MSHFPEMLSPGWCYSSGTLLDTNSYQILTRLGRGVSKLVGNQPKQPEAIPVRFQPKCSLCLCDPINNLRIVSKSTRHPSFLFHDKSAEHCTKEDHFWALLIIAREHARSSTKDTTRPGRISVGHQSVAVLVSSCEYQRKLHNNVVTPYCLRSLYLQDRDSFRVELQ